jgi:hypothetical protein
MEPGIHCVRTHWIRGFMAFQLAPGRRIVRLMVLVGSESGFQIRLSGTEPREGEGGLVGSGQVSELRR